ncbi:MAG: hypothetical protein FWG45_01155 [Oscillospiraceae bacterium]|nr:hypothetical protein [Oscillospiraceae bacterium]
MNDFNLDDILKEIDGKKSGKKPDTAPPPSLSDEVGSVTAELAEIEQQRFAETKTDLSVTQILNEQSSQSAPSRQSGDMTVTQIIDAKKAERAPETPDTAPPTPTAATESQPQSPMQGTVQPVQIKRFTAKKRSATKTGEIKRIKPRKPPGESAKAVVNAVVDTMNNLPVPPEPPKTPPLKTPALIEREPGSKPAAYLSPEEKERLHKLREEELLEKELALEDPDELIDGLNPYDVKNIEAPATAELVSVRETQENLVQVANTLETPAAPKVAKTSRDDTPDDGDAPVKEFTPKSNTSPLFDPYAADKAAIAGNAANVKKTRKKSAIKGVVSEEKYEELNITPVLENLNKSFNEKRKDNLNARKTLNVDTLSSVGSGRSGYKGKTIPLLNIDYKKQVIENSSVLPHVDVKAKQIEKTDLRNKKKRKIRDFIYEDIDEKDDEFFFEDESEGDDYDSLDSSEQVWLDLDDSHKGLRWRFVLLLLTTALLTLFTIMHDLGPAAPFQGILINDWFDGNSARYATVYIFANIIAGVIGIGLCSGAILRGLKNLFIGRADCDSACALPIVLTTVMSVLYLFSETSNGLIQGGQTHIYVTVALAGLMFNTLGKIFMIVRTKRNFSFISGDSVKYSAYMPNPSEERAVRDFTKGILHDVPASVFLRKTEFLTDYLKNSYCTDWADHICRKLVPISAAVSVVMGTLAYFLPVANEHLVRNAFWGFTVTGAFLTMLSSFTTMFIVNAPLLKASKMLAKRDCVVMGYLAAQKYARANAVIIDAGLLFPPGTVRFLNVKRCQKPNAINSISIDESIVIAASLAIKTESVMSSMFYDMINGDKDILYKIEGCIYEVNMGITGWMGAKRVMLGNRDQMKHHGVDVPAENKERRHCPDNADIVYLAVGNESVAMFIIEVIPSPAIKHSLWALDEEGVVVAVKTKDSLVTKSKLADIYDLNPEKVKILSFDQHTGFDDFSRYTSRGSSEIACGGTFTSLSKALVTAKMLIRHMTLNMAAMFASIIVAGILGLFFVIFAASGTGAAMSSTVITLYNTAALAVMFIIQGLRRY